MSKTLQVYEALYVSLGNEFNHWHLEVERLTKEEHAIHVIQQKAVSRRNNLQSAMQAIFSSLIELRKEVWSELDITSLGSILIAEAVGICGREPKQGG